MMAKRQGIFRLFNTRFPLQKSVSIGVILLSSMFLAYCDGNSSGDSSGRQRSRRTSASNDLNESESSNAATGSEKLETAARDGSQAVNSKDFSRDDLEKMPLGELMLFEQERHNQDLAEEEELQLLDAINTEICHKLNEKRQNCPAIKRLIPDPSEKGLQCAGEDKKKPEVAPKITVTLPSQKLGSFLLIANDLYTSSAFGPGGPSPVTFTTTGGGDLQAPQFLKIYKLVLRSADKAHPKLPELAGFDIKITIDAGELLSEYLSESEDPSHKDNQTEYRIPVDDIIALRKSSDCNVTQSSIDQLKASIRNAVLQDQVLSRKDAYKLGRESLDVKQIGDQKKKRAELIENIFQYRTSIEYRFPILEGERNRQFKLANELKTDVQIGCHARQPITSFELELEGSVNPLAPLGKKDSKQVDQFGDGKPSEIYFDFGGLKFTVDFAKENIFGTRYIYDKDISDEALVNSLERIYLRKRSVAFDNIAVPCKNDNGILATFEKMLFDDTCYEVYEKGVFTISAITIYVNGKKAYSRRGLETTFNQENKTWEDDLSSNDMWVKLMLDEDCSINN